MLTGDNPFTAVNIAHSCGLIEKNQKTFFVKKNSRKEIKEEFEKIKEHIKKKNRQLSESNYYYCSSDSNDDELISSSDSCGNFDKTDFCLVITGDALTMVQKDQTRVETINNNNDDEINSNNKEKNVKNQSVNRNNVSSHENRSASEKSNHKIEDLKRKQGYKDSNLILDKNEKEYLTDSEGEYSSRSNIKSINNHGDEIEICNRKENKEKAQGKKQNESKNDLNRKESYINNNNEGIEEGSLLNLFLEIITSTNTVICSRVSPKQKADLILMIKRHEKENMTTLAIGDGANDVNMITAADVGIGIMGNEGQQAARASDYVIGQFSFLKRLLFVHGREAQRKNAFAIGYILWKNFLYVIPMIM